MTSVQKIFSTTYIHSYIIVNKFIYWAILQNLHQHSAVDNDNVRWASKFIRALWQYSHSIWIERCTFIHRSRPDNLQSLTHSETIVLIRQLLRTPRDDLSMEEKRLHHNISRNLQLAHTKTLIQWLHLLREARAETIRRKANTRPGAPGQNLITRFFRRL